MEASGLEVFEKRKKKRSRQASYEQKAVELKKEYKEQIKQNKKGRLSII